MHGPVRSRYPNRAVTLIDRVRNPKNQLSQINSLTTVGCSLEYPTAMKLEVRLLSSQTYALLIWTRPTSCSTQKTERNLLLSQTLSRVVVGKKDPHW